MHAPGSIVYTERLADLAGRLTDQVEDGYATLTVHDEHGEILADHTIRIGAPPPICLDPDTRQPHRSTLPAGLTTAIRVGLRCRVTDPEQLATALLEQGHVPASRALLRRACAEIEKDLHGA